jgi:hypothetical protein
MFGPGFKDVEWAVRVVIADTEAERAGRAAWSLDGKMIDVPVVQTKGYGSKSQVVWYQYLRSIRDLEWIASGVTMYPFSPNFLGLQPL